MIVQSSSQKDPYIFFKLLKKNDNGAWEKLSKGEGKTIKFSLEELVLILQVLKMSEYTLNISKLIKLQTDFEFNRIDKESYITQLTIFLEGSEDAKIRKRCIIELSSPSIFFF